MTENFVGKLWKIWSRLLLSSKNLGEQSMREEYCNVD